MELKILVAEDDESFRTVLHIALKREGYKTMVAEEGTTALQLHQRYHFDIVISDVRMNHMDGLSLVEKIRKINPNTAVILMSSYLSAKEEARSKMITPYHFLLKPFQYMQLLEIIRDFEKEKHLIEKEK